MPEVCKVGAVVTLDDCIYVVGGHNSKCLKYDPALDNWATLNRRKQSHGHSILVAGAVFLRMNHLALSDMIPDKTPGLAVAKLQIRRSWHPTACSKLTFMVCDGLHFRV